MSLRRGTLYTGRLRMFVVPFALVGCEGKLRDDAKPVSSLVASSFAPIASSQSMPRQEHVLERAGDSCVLFSVLGSERALGDPVDCPGDLEDGERIRLAGRVCLRESGNAHRSLPVRCPSQLVDVSEGRARP